MQIKGNKGEWSEMYVFLKMLGSENIKIDNKEYKEFSIIRYFEGEVYEYKKGNLFVELFENGKYSGLTIPKTEFELLSKILKKDIINNKGRSFSVSKHIVTFLEKIKVKSIKASFCHKEDMIIAIDGKKMGFSIKSFLGKPPCLFSGSANTNIVYKIRSDNNAYDESFLDKVNNIYTSSGGVALKSRINTLLSKYTLEPITFECDAMHNNLNHISNKIEKVLMNVVLSYYTLKDRKSTTNIKRIIDTFPNSVECTSELVNFAKECDKSLQPTVNWSKNSFIKGTIYVKRDGSIHISMYESDDYNKILEKVRIDRGSANRYDYGKIVFYNNVPYFKINMQIRYRAAA